MSNFLLCPTFGTALPYIVGQLGPGPARCPFRLGGTEKIESVFSFLRGVLGGRCICMHDMGIQRSLSQRDTSSGVGRV